jgi:hypothetical protein
VRLSRPQKDYDSARETQNQFTIEQADMNNHKRDQDIEVGDAEIILRSANGTRYSLDISDAGVLSTSAV